VGLTAGGTTSTTREHRWTRRRVVAVEPAADPPARTERHWNVQGVSPGDRFDAWCDIVTKTHLGFAVDRSERSAGPFLAEVREQRLGDLALLDASVLPHRGRRTSRQVSQNTRDVVGLHFLLSGRQAVEIDGERVILGPGDAMIWDGSSTGGYEILEPLHKRTLILPRSVAATALPNYRQTFVRVLNPTNPRTSALVNVLTVLGDQLPAMDTGARQASASLVVELLRSLHPEDQRTPAKWSAWQLREQALQYIDENLGDTKLCPATTAAAHAVSLRTLYSALDGLGMTLAAYIRHRRLARCYDDLVLSTAPVGVIASRWGFGSPAHFSRAFRQRYGMPPNEARRQPRIL
jgi:AraC family transcriptional activator of tynA and feaB